MKPFSALGRKNYNNLTEEVYFNKNENNKTGVTK